MFIAIMIISIAVLLCEKLDKAVVNLAWKKFLSASATTVLQHNQKEERKLKKRQRSESSIPI